MHAYPPWHTAFCWWYGWISFDALRLIMLAVDIFSLAFCAIWAWRRCSQLRRYGVFGVGVLLLSICAPSVIAIVYGNYGCLSLLLMVVLIESLERGHDVLAGLAWALLMIKPQNGLLVACPLLFAGKWKTITVAVSLCVAATLWSAWVYGCSPVELLMQIPQIGKPYFGSATSGMAIAAGRLLGAYGSMIVAGFAVAFCAAASWLLRDAKSWIVRFAAVFMIYTFWTYSSFSDAVARSFFFVLLAVGFTQEIEVDVSASGFMDKALVALPIAYVAGSALVVSRFDLICLHPGLSWGWGTSIHRIGMAVSAFASLALLLALVLRRESFRRSGDGRLTSDHCEDFAANVAQ